MKKHFLFLFSIICFLNLTTKAQVYPFTDGFETYTPLFSNSGLIGAGYQTDSFKLYNNTHAYASSQCASIRLSAAYNTDVLATPVIGPITGASYLEFYARSCSAFGPYPRQHFLRTGENIQVVAFDSATSTTTNLLTIDSTNQNTGGAYVKYTINIGSLAGSNIRIKFNVNAVSTNFIDIDSIILRDTVVVIPPAFALNPTINSPLCPGASNGSIYLAPSGGIAPYTYLWSDSSTYDSLVGLAAGNYTVTVTDSAGSIVTQTITVNNPAGLAGNVVRVNPFCPGDTNGTATAHITGGAAPYSYVWSNGATDSTASNLAPGNYTVTVTDNNGCTTTRNTTIQNPRGMILRFTTLDESAAGANDGYSHVRVTNGGTPGFSYSWSNGTVGPNNDNLTAGYYCVTVTDTNGCTVTACDTITVALPIAMQEVFHFDVTCFGEATGTVRVRGINGQFPYSYDWGGGNTNPVLTGLVAGTYTVTITDNAGRTGTGSVIITEPAEITATISNTPTSGTGSTGTATVTPSGGVAPYTYLWSPGGETTPNITGLGVGTYSVDVFDANGCVRTFTTDIIISGISKLDLNHAVSIFPTPCTNELFIELSTSNFESYIISDVSGRIIFTHSIDMNKKVQNIDVTTLTKGQYTIQLIAKEGTRITRKFVKQ